MWEIPDIGVNHLDRNLKSGPYDTAFAQPGSIVEKLSSDGKSWTPIYKNANGIWGLDLLSHDIGWVVNVTSLVETSDGGQHWKTLSEPAGTHLVAVAFTGPEAGYGLTSNGSLVSTNNGGVSWQLVDTSEPGAAMCLSEGTLYVGGSDGSIFRMPTSGGTPSKAYSNNLQVPQGSLWIDMSCNQGTVAHAEVDAAPSGSSAMPFEVQLSQNNGQTWPVVADSGTSSIGTPGGVAQVPSMNGLLASSSGVAIASQNAGPIEWTGVNNSGQITTPPQDSIYKPTSPYERVSVGGLALAGDRPDAEINSVTSAGTSTSVTALLFSGSNVGGSWTMTAKSAIFPVQGGNS